VVTAAVRCGLVVRGPGVAPLWPSVAAGIDGNVKQKRAMGRWLSMKDGKAAEPARPLLARLVTVAGLVQAVAGWTVLLALAGLAARTRGAWIALAIVYLFGLAPLVLLVVNSQRRGSRSAGRGP
jgi:hypothetical protein